MLTRALVLGLVATVAFAVTGCKCCGVGQNCNSCIRTPPPCNNCGPTGPGVIVQPGAVGVVPPPPGPIGPGPVGSPYSSPPPGPYGASYERKL